MKRHGKAALTLAGIVALGLLSPGAVRAEGWYVGSFCNPETPYEPGWYHEATNIVNGAGGVVNIRCGIPNDETLTNVTFQFAVQRNGAGTSTCQGFIRDTAGNAVWASNTTTHSSGGLSIVATNDGPAGNDTRNYSTYCNLAAGHKFERTRLY